MQNLLKEDLEHVVSRIPERIANVLVDLGRDVFVGGGFIRACIANERGSDIDVFVRDKETADKIQKKLNQEPYETEFAKTFTGNHRPIQIIHRWFFSTPYSLLEHFDFSVCQAVVWYDDKWRSVCSNEFYPDLAAKRLRFVGKTDRDGIESGGTLLRLVRYVKKGYNPPLETLAQVVHQGHQDGEDHHAILGTLEGIDPRTVPPWLFPQGDNDE